MPVHGDPDLVLTGGRLAVPDAVLDDGWLAVTGNRIAGVGTGEPPTGHRIPLDGALVVPGFVDLHCHGGGGGSYAAGPADAAGPTDTTGPADAATALATHRAHGTTTTLASLVSAPPAVLADRVAALSDLVADGELAGIHLEGPFLAEARCGAHDPAALREPDPATVDALLAAGRDSIRMVTLAPELPGAVEAIRQLTDAGVLAAIGHTDASGDVVGPAVDAGARVATHLFNGMRPLHHREPGPVGVLLDDERVTVELIADLVHVHPTVLRLAARHAGLARTAAVTDAMAGTDAPDGRYPLGRLDVEVTGGVATLPSDGTLAGSTLTMDAAFRHLVRDVGLTVPEAVAATAGHPAALLGLSDTTGSLRPGRSADLVVLDADLRPAGVLRRGGWVGAPPDGARSGPRPDRDGPG